jgi:putative oxidoreductase
MATPAAVSQPSLRPAAWLRVLLILGRVALGAIFVYAAFTKLYFNGGWHFGDYQFFFGMAINSYNLLPLWAVQWAARILPWFELGLGIFLIAGPGLRWTGSIASALLLLFIGAMTNAYMKGLEIMCGCFGNNEKLGPLTLLRDSSLLILALAVTLGAFLIKKRKTTVSP